MLLIVPIGIANVRSRFNWASKDEMGREKAPYSTVLYGAALGEMTLVHRHQWQPI